MGVAEMKRDYEERLATMKRYYEGVFEDGGERIKKLAKEVEELQARLNEMEFIKKKLERYMTENIRLEEEVFNLTCEIQELTEYGDED